MALPKKLLLVFSLLVAIAIVRLINLGDASGPYRRQVSQHRMCNCSSQSENCRRGCEMKCEIDLSRETRNEQCDFELKCRCARHLCRDSTGRCSARQPVKCAMKAGKKQCVEVPYHPNVIPKPAAEVDDYSCDNRRQDF